jgi:hypothetical protein
MKQTYSLNYRFLLPFLVLVTLLSSNNSNAQCGPYQAFESFKSGTIAANTYASPATLPFTEGTVAGGNWTGYSLVVQTTGLSGIRSISLSTAYSVPGTGSYIITPKINSLKSLSFYYKSIAAGTGNILVEYSYDYNGSTIGTSTWNTYTGSAMATSTAYTLHTFDFSTLPLSGPVYVRISRGTGAAVPQIDDVSWTSTVASENLEIIAGRGASTNCSQNLLASYTYIMYDNGGADDTYSASQNNIITVVPPIGYAANFNFPAGGTVTNPSDPTCSDSTDWIKLYNGTSASALLNKVQTGCATAAVPAGTILSTDCLGRLTAVFNSDGSVPTAFALGFKINVTTTATATCSDVASVAVTSGTSTYDGATITWTAPCPVPNTGYDYYVSTSNSAPGATATGSISNVSPTITLTGLSSLTTYYVWIRSNCGGSSGNWIAASTTFTTICPPVLVPPTYTIDFEGSLSLPTCVQTNSGSTGITTASGNNYWYNTNANTWLFSNPLTLDPTKIYRLSFDYANSVGNATTVNAYYGSSPYTPSAAITTSLMTSVTTSSTTFATSRSYFQPAAAGPYYIGIKLNSIAGGALKLDNIVLEVVPCFPAATPVIAGPTAPCPAITATYTATATPTAVSSAPTSYTWTVPTGWVINSGQGTASIQVTTSVMTGNITATSNLTGCDSSAAVNYAVSAAAIPAQPSSITGSGAICGTGTSTTYSVTNVAGVIYNWVFPSGWNITAGAGTNSITVTPTGAAVSGTITVTPSNASGCAGLAKTKAVVVGSVNNTTCAVATPMTNTISDTFRCNSFNFWYSFTATCAESYKISLVGTGTGSDIDLFVYHTCTAGTASVSQGSGTTTSRSESVTTPVLVPGDTYYIRVFDYTGNGSGTSAGGNFTLSIASTSMGALGSMTGSPSVSCSSVTEGTYSVTPVSGATSYIWTVSPNSWTLEHGQGSTSIDISTDGSSAGNISVVAVGPCGYSSPTSLSIAVGQITPGTITGATGLCTSTANTTYSVAAVMGAVSYTWTLPSGWTFVGPSNGTSITVTPGASGGTISVTATGPCGTSPASTLAVSTAAAVTTTGVTVCPGFLGTVSATLSAVTTFGMSNITSASPAYIRTSTATGSNTTYTASGTSVVYTTQNIVPTVTGNYTFAGCAAGDSFLQIYSGTFNPASPATNFMIYDDDSNGTVCALDPNVTIALTAGQTYVLVYSAWSGFVTSISGITITVTPPSGGGVQIGSVEWYDDPVAGTLIGTGTIFNPVGALPGLIDTSLPGIHTVYGTNSLSSFCRTATTFTISPKPTVTITTTPATVCANTVNAVNVTGTATTYTWSSSVSNTLFSNALGTIPYVAGTNSPIVYVKSGTTVTVTVTGTNTTTTCTNTAPILFTIPNRTWNGVTWVEWNGTAWVTVAAPTITDSAVIAGNYSAGSFQACSCTVNSGTVNFSSGQTMTLQNDLYVNGGSVNFGNGASLVQISTPTANSNSGNITYSRITSIRKFDYTYWSSPVDLQLLFALSPFTLSDKYFWLNTTTYSWEQVANPGSTPMDIGKGYIIRGPQTYDPFVAAPWTGNFVGKPNNGNYNVPIVKTGVNDLNCIGNPYPSAISANLFVSQNTAAFGATPGTTLYFWTHNTPLTNNNYTFDDYATWNYSGGTGTGGAAISGGTQPNGNIGAGQAFMAKAVVAGTTTATFKNNMRLAANNTQFFRSGRGAVLTATDLERHRLWLDLQNDTGAFKQLLVGYIENATNGYDNGYDGDFLPGGANAIRFYSILEDKTLSIQGRALPFNDADLIPLGYKANTAGFYTIALSQYDGVFESQQVYLEDKLMGIIQLLSDAPYSFVTEAGTFDTRFVLRFKDSILGIIAPSHSENGIVVYKENTDVHIATANVDMKAVQLYDIRGRLISEQQQVNNKTALFSNLNLAHQVLIVNVTTADGVTVSKKIIF